MAQPIGKLKIISTYFSAFPEAFEPFIPQNEVLFFNLGKLSKEDLMGFQHGMIQSARLIQQNFGNPEELGKHVRKIVESLAPYFDKAGIRSIFHYLVSFVEIEREELIQIVDEVSNQNHPNMKTEYDQLIELGVEKGIEKGVESGREKGILISLQNGFDMGLTMSQLQKLTELPEERFKILLKANGRQGHGIVH